MKELKCRCKDKPEGNHACKIDQIYKTVELQKKGYKTIIYFRNSGGINTQGFKVDNKTN